MSDLAHLLIDLIRGRDEHPDTADVCAEVSLLVRLKVIDGTPTEAEIVAELAGLERAGMLANEGGWRYCPQRRELEREPQLSLF